MLELLEYAFMQRALVAAVLVGALCSTVAFFVVLRRLAFVGVGVSHSALGGVAIGVLSGVNPVVSGAVFATLVSWVIGWVSRKSDISEDTAIGTFSTASMALGVVLLGFAPSYTADLMSFLFGNILAVTSEDLAALGLTTLLVVGFIALFFKELLTMTFEEELAKADGLPVDFLYFGLLTSVALTVVVSVKVVGVVLSSALLVIPGAIGKELTRDFRKMLAIAAVSGTLSTVSGLFLSFYWDVAPGATIVLSQTALFVLAYALSPKKRRLARRRAAARA